MAADSTGGPEVNNHTSRTRRLAASVTIAAGMLATTPYVVGAATPMVEYDDGAFVRLVGNPADGTAKFQYGWAGSSPSSAAAGYWVGLYDVTNSHYEWAFDTGPTDQPDRLLRNALPTADLANGEYKAVFFVRATYGPATNIAEIELPFVVSNSGM